MTNKEVQDKLKQAKNKEWFKSITAKFDYKHLELHVEKIGFYDIYLYVKRQCREWKKIDFNLPNHFKHSRSDFYHLETEIENFIEHYIEEDENNLKHQWLRIANMISAISNNKRFPIDHPKSTFLIELFKISDNHYIGGFNYFFPPRTFSITNPEQLAGSIMAYEFQFEDATKIPRRRNAEKSSNSIIRNNFERAFTESTQNVNAFLQKVKKDSASQAKKVSELIEEKQEAYENWVAECKKNDQEYTKQSLERVKELEELYNSKLGLQAPADYWEQRAIELDGDGKKWRGWLISIIIFSVVVLTSIIFIIAYNKIEDLFSSTGNAIRFSILFIALMSIIAFAIKVFSKLMMSSYHLKRDALERKQLAYFYLALKASGGIEKEERHLIIQSLFSRSDSGLLKDDAGPSMPSGGNTIEKIIGGGK